MLHALTHHFYIIEGDTENSTAELLEHLEKKEGIVLQANPDIHKSVFQSLSIDDARVIKDFFATRGFSDARRIAIVTSQSISREAQNALLKLTEELPERSHLFFIIPHTGLLIDTLLSRGEKISFLQTSASPLADQGKQFLKKPVAGRLEEVQKIITKKDKTAAIELIDGVIAYARSLPPTTDTQKILKEVYTVRSYIEDTSSSIKLLLEHLSLILPVLK